MSYTASVITVSDLGSRGLRQDTSGPAVRAMLEDAGFTVVHTAIVPDERGQISALLRACADEKDRPHPHHRRHGAFPTRRHAGGDRRRAGAGDPRHSCGYVGGGTEDHAKRHALPRRRRYARQQPYRQSAGLGKGGARKSRCRARRAGARPAHDRRRGSRLSRRPQTARRTLRVNTPLPPAIRTVTAAIKRKRRPAGLRFLDRRSEIQMGEIQCVPALAASICQTMASLSELART